MKDQILIAKFRGPKPAPEALEIWLQTLDLKLKDGALTLSRNVGRAFFFLAGKEKEALHNALMMSPYKSQWGTCMFQRWVPNFNPDNPSNLVFPTWVTLKNLPYEHFDQAYNIAESMGEIIGIAISNEEDKDPRFCINLYFSKGWVTSISLEVEEGILPPQIVIVDYDSLPIRCKACMSWKHKVKDCQELKKGKKSFKDASKPLPTHHQRH